MPEKKLMPAKKYDANHRSGARHHSGDSVVRMKGRLLPVLLNARRAQAGQAMLVDRVLPGQKFLDGQRVAIARLFERKQAAADRRHDFRLAADDPAFRPWR